jgi:hypothetical protein
MEQPNHEQGHSVTQLIMGVKTGDEEAVRALLGRYFHRLVGLARKRMQGTPRVATDEEDVALHAFDSFCRAAEQQRFPDLNDRNSLWRLLATITFRKARAVFCRENAAQRGGARTRRRRTRSRG